MNVIILTQLIKANKEMICSFII